MPRSKYTRKTQDHGKRVKDDEKYEALRRKGHSKEKAARIANSSSTRGRSKTGQKGGTHAKYEDWSKQELYDMDKDESISALRNH